MTCKVESTEIIGPIFDGDEVIIAPTFEFTINGETKTSLGYLDIANTNPVGKEDNFYVINSNEDQPFNPKTVPRFKIHFLSKDPNGGNNPYVFFVLNNPKEVHLSCNCTSGITNIPFAGIGVTSYPPTITPQTPQFDTDDPKVKFIYPGPPAPIQLIAANGATPWFPMTDNPKNPTSANYALALSNVPYTMNAVVEGERFENINTIASIDAINLRCTPGRGPGGCKKQIYYIIPTKFFESTTGSSLCKACVETSNNDAALGAFCSVGCQFAKNNNINTFFCCDGDCNGEGLDCSNVCKYGFTDKKDCTDNCFYQYCKAGQHCNGDCKSSCQNQTDICTLKDNTYSCIPLPIPPVINALDLSTTEIVVIAIIALFIIALVIYVIYAWATEYNKPTPTA